MDDEIKKQLLDYSKQLENAATRGAEFVSEHAPETVYQFLAWNFWASIFCASIFAIFTVLAVFYTRKIKNYVVPNAATYSDRKWNEEARHFAGAIGVIVTIAISSGIWVNLYTALKIKVAPNVFIIEKLAELIKK